MTEAEEQLKKAKMQIERQRETIHEYIETDRAFRTMEGDLRSRIGGLISENNIKAKRIRALETELDTLKDRSRIMNTPAVAATKQFLGIKD